MLNQKINDIRNLAVYLYQNYREQIIICAQLALELAPGDEILDREPEELNLTFQLAARIYDVMTGIDEPRFTLFDYADAVVNARQSVNMAKLMGLDDENFAATLIWLAVDKRDTYEDKPHDQMPLELDIYDTGSQNHNENNTEVDA